MPPMVVVATFNQEKALVGAFSVIVKTDCCRWIVCNSISVAASHGPGRAQFHLVITMFRPRIMRVFGTEATFSKG